LKLQDNLHPSAGQQPSEVKDKKHKKGCSTRKRIDLYGTCLIF
jgi:hypothetical protein